nr:Hpt domain-containing protein [uncultured Cohaesibacter sp.]
MIDQLRSLVARHCESLKRDMAGLEKDIDAIGSEPELSAAQIECAIAKTHKVKGSSGTIGFQDVSESAAALEQALKGLLPLSAALPDEERLGQISDTFARLADLVASLKPEQSRLYDMQFPADIPARPERNEEDFCQRQIGSASSCQI